ncbi:MAG: Rrf2 family transcriptional regulator [Bacteroidota bacterium]
MMFSKKCEYALKAAIYLYIKSIDGKKLGIKELAKEIESPEPFTAKILQELVRAKIISSNKGPNGGFYIDPKAKPVLVIDLIDLIDGKDSFDRCGLGLKECSESHPCPIHKEFKSYSSRLKKLLTTKTLKEFAESVELGDAFINN